MERRTPIKGPSAQRGATTLVVSMVTLVLVSLVTVYGSRSVVTEQRIMSNDARSRQAFEAAEAGLAAAIEYMSEGRDRDGDELLDSYVFDTDGDGVGDTDTTTFANDARAVVTPTDLSGEMAMIRIESQGFSDDASATRTVTRVISALDPLPNVPDNPLTTRGTVVITGSATVINPEGHSTIWSGSNVDLGSNNSTHTEVADATDPDYPACMDTSRTCSTVSTSNKVTEGLDIVEYDDNLRSLSSGEFFENFFGMLPASFRDTMVTMEATSADADETVQLATNEVIWVDGDANFDNNTTVGCSSPVTGSGVCSPSETEPSIMVIDGNATFDGTPHMYGLVFVTGQINVTGNTTVYGALIASGAINHSAGGSLQITYDSEILEASRKNGPFGSSAGSWRDFL